MRQNIINICKVITISLLVVFGVHHHGISGGDERTSLQGTVIDNETEEPVSDVNVMIQGTTIGTSTAHDGIFLLENVPAGLHIVEFSHINYFSYSRPHVFMTGITETIHIEMQSRPIIFDEVEVVDTIPAERSPARMLGYNYDREDIERAGSVTFAQLIRTLVPQARVRESGGNLYIQLRQRATIAQRYDRTRDSNPLIIIDGMQIGTSPIGLSGILNPMDIEHLTVVRPPESQSLYGLNATHGAIVIETKDRSDEEQLLTTAQKLYIASGLAALMILMHSIF